MAKLFIPLVTAQAKALVNRLTVYQMDQYEELKRFLLAEYSLTPREYKVRFVTATKSTEETFVLFTWRCAVFQRKSCFFISFFLLNA